jgi:hypothetical protein
MTSTQIETDSISNQLISMLQHLEDKHNEKDQQWFQKLLDHNSRNLEAPDIEAGLIINLTVLDCIVAKLLNLDIKLLTKIKVVGTYINQIWNGNGGDPTKLTDFIISEDQALRLSKEFNLPIAQNNITNDLYPLSVEESSLSSNSRLQETTNTSLNITNPPIESSFLPNINNETTIKEIEMSDRVFDELVEKELAKLQENDEHIRLKEKVLGQNIATKKNYATRNRTPQHINPYFLDNKGSYKAGVLIPSIPGEGRIEQINYIAKLLKLPQNSELLHFDFLNGNGWITFRFQEIEDMQTCISKTMIKNKKNGDHFKIFPLHSTATNEKKEALHTETFNDTTSREPITISNPTKHLSTTSDTKTHVNTLNKGKGKESVKETNETFSQNKYNTPSFNNPNNPFNISDTPQKIQAGILSGKMAGNNRLEQNNLLAEALQIPKENNLITNTFHNGNNWLIINLQNTKDFVQCKKALKDNNPSIDLIQLSSPNKNIIDKKEMFSNVEENGYTNTTHLKLTILDIPTDFPSNRIKGALKCYGKIIDFKTSKHTTFTKKAIVKIEKLSNSKNLTNVWGIPMGDIMARITIGDANPIHIKSRNQYTARLYGIATDTSATRIMSAIKHTGAKFCYIPRNSLSNKKRHFAVVEFASSTEQKRALRSCITLSDKKLTWKMSNNSSPNQHKDTSLNSYSTSSKSHKPVHIYSDIEYSSDKSTANFERKTSIQMDWTSVNTDNDSISDAPLNKIAKDQKKNYKRINKNINKKTIPTHNMLDSLSLLTDQLQEISKRLSNLESNHSKMNLTAHNRS